MAIKNVFDIVMLSNVNSHFSCQVSSSLCESSAVDPKGVRDFRQVYGGFVLIYLLLNSDYFCMLFILFLRNPRVLASLICTL